MLEIKITPEIHPRNQQILLAYGNIAMNLRRMLNAHTSRDYRRYVEFQYPHELRGNLVRELACSYCSLKINEIRGDYILTLTIGRKAYDQGSSLDSNALLRLAFKFTMYEGKSLDIESCLNITFNSSCVEYFYQRMTDYEQL